MLSALNTDPPESSAALTAALLRETLAAGGRACHPLFAGHGLAKSFIDPALAFLAARGADVRFADRLRAIRFEGSRAVALDFDGEAQALGSDDFVLLAVPPSVAKDLLPGLETPDDFRGILNVHFRVSPPPDQPAILGVVNGEIEWLFAFPDRLSVTISNADRLIDSPREALAARIWREAASLTGLPDKLPPWRSSRRNGRHSLRRRTGRKASACANPTRQCRSRGRLDRHRSSRDNRRRRAIGI